MKKQLFAILFLLIISTIGWGQIIPRKLTGKVVTSGNVPLESVSLKFLGTTVGGQSGKDRKFTLTFPGKGNVTLVASHIGYKSLTALITTFNS